MDRLLLVLGAVAVAGAIATVLRRPRPSPPAANTHHIPTQLDRDDFVRPDAPWLVVTFTSATCSTCAGVRERASVLESSEVAVQEVEIGTESLLHERYRIDGVPTLVVADATGLVRRAFLGPITATDLWAAVAEVREPGSVPEGCDHGFIED